MADDDLDPTDPGSGQGTGPGPGTAAAAPLSDADLWEHYVAGGVPKDSATAIVRDRSTMSPADTWERLTANGMSKPDATAAVPLSHAVGPAAPTAATTPATDVTGAQLAGPGGTANTTVDAGLKGLTFGASDWAIPLMHSLRTGMPLGQSRALYEQEREQQEGAHGTANTLATLGGAIASPINKVGEAIGAGAQAAGAAGRTLRAMISGGVNSGLAAGGLTDGSLEDRAKAAGIGAAGGALLAPAADYVGGKVLPAVGRGLRQMGIGPDIPTPTEAASAVDAAHRPVTDAAYAKMRALPDLTDAPTIQTVMNTPSLYRAYQEGAASLRLDGDDIPLLPNRTFPDEASPKLQSNPKLMAALAQANQADLPDAIPIRGIDAMKQVLDEDPKAPHYLMGKLLARVDKFAPDYQAARQTAQQGFQLQNVLQEAGTKRGSLYGPAQLAAGAATGSPYMLARGAANTFADAASSRGAGQAARTLAQLAPTMTRVSPDVLRMAQDVLPPPFSFGQPGAGASRVTPAAIAELLPKVKQALGRYSKQPSAP